MSRIENNSHMAYATHLRDQHRQLCASLDRVEQQWRHLGRRSIDRAELLASLIELRAELVHHLAQEVDGGCVEEAAIHTPRLTHAETELEREDPELLAQFDHLISRLNTAAVSLRILEKEYHRLVERICEHAATESRIVEESFGMEID